MTVLVPHAVYIGIEAVRSSGLTNMLDCPRVAELAEAMGFHQSARWIRENRDRYAQAVFNGFQVVADQPETAQGQDGPARTEPNDNPGG